MPLTAGEKLGPYEILALLGAGRMGEVYRARDTRLERTVASLNHPNIRTLSDRNQDGTIRLTRDGVKVLDSGGEVECWLPTSEMRDDRFHSLA